MTKPWCPVSPFRDRWKKAVKLCINIISWKLKSTISMQDMSELKCPLVFSHRSISYCIPLVGTNKFNKEKNQGSQESTLHPEKNPRIGIPCCKIREPVPPASAFPGLWVLFRTYITYIPPVRLQPQVVPDFLKIRLTSPGTHHIGWRDLVPKCRIKLHQTLSSNPSSHPPILPTSPDA